MWVHSTRMGNKIVGTLGAHDRQEWVRRELDERGRLTLDDIASKFGVSRMTVRRDLVELEAIGAARRVRGGAVAVGPLAFEDRNRQRVRAKSEIAAKLVPLVPSTGAISFDSSSTILRLTAALNPPRSLLVLTNGLQTFAGLSERSGITPVLTGGAAIGNSGVLAGPVASGSAASVMSARFFCSATSVDSQRGASELTLEGAEVKSAMARAAREVVLAVDASKLETTSVALALDWSCVDILVTELDPADPQLDPYRGLAEII